MYSWLAEAAENNSIVLTASRRLSRVLNTEFARQQLALGNQAWRSPKIRFLDDWLSSIVDSAPDELPICLNGHASSVVWERCLIAQAGDQLINTAGLIRQARQSWQRLHDWQVPLSEVSAAARSQDEQLFAAAAENYQAILADNHWIDSAQLIGHVTKLFEKGIDRTPNCIVYAGFDRLVPNVEHLLSIHGEFFL